MLHSRERRAWTAHEDELLREAIAKEDPGRLHPSKWHAISKHIPGRTNKDCRKRWFAKMAPCETARGCWSTEEDERLKKAVEKYGTKWIRVAAEVQTRNSDQCSKRWKDTLDPKIDHTGWSSEEVVSFPALLDDNLLLDAVNKYGTLWSKIVKIYFPRRTGLAAKNRYNSLTRSGVSTTDSTTECTPSSSDASSSESPSSSSASPATPPSLSLPDQPNSPQTSQIPYLDMNEFMWLDSPKDLDILPPLDSYELNGLLLPPISTFDSLNLPSLGALDSDMLFCPGIIPDSFVQPIDIHADTSSVQPFSTKVLKLYGHSLSPSTLRVAVVLHEKQIPYEFFSIDITSDKHKSEEHLANQPFGRVPYIDDDGFILYESRAICRYLASKYSSQGVQLVPPSYDPQAVALFDQAIFTEVFNFEPHAHRAVYERVIKGCRGLASDQDVFDSSISALSLNLDAYEVILSKHKYIAGDELTLADLYHLPCGEMLKKAGSDLMFSKGPNVQRWWTEISSRVSWAVLKDGVPVGSG